VAGLYYIYVGGPAAAGSWNAYALGG